MAKQRCVTVNAVAMFCGVRGSTYRPYLCSGTRDRARHVASRRICPHIHVLCMPACVPMSARPRSGSPHDDLHRSSDNWGEPERAPPGDPQLLRCLYNWRAERANLVLQLARFFYIFLYGRCTYRIFLNVSTC